MNFEWLDAILQCSPPLALALAINLALFASKRIPMPGWVRPILAMGIGAIAYPFLADISKLNYNVRSPALYLTLIGTSIGGLSVCFNQVVRQWIKSKTGSDPMSDTDEITKSPDHNGPDH